MQKILATLAIMLMAACGSAAQTGPKTTNPPLAKEPAPKTGTGDKPPVENDGLKLKINVLDFQMTMTPANWKGQIAQQQNGSIRLVFQRPDVPAAMLVIPVKQEKSDAKSFAADWQKQAADQGMTATAVVDEGHGRFAFTADGTTDGQPVRTYVGVLPHPTIKDAYLVFIGSCDPKNGDSFFKEVRTVADSVGPIK